MKVNTVSPEIIFITSPNNWMVNHPPFYYMALAAWLEREGHSCEIIDEKIGMNLLLMLSERHRKQHIFNKILSKIRILNPRYIGIGAFVTDYNIVIELAREIKQRFDIPIIVGNAHATISPQDFIFEGSPIDFAVIGEGEITLTELLDTLNAKSNTDKVNGLAFLRDGQIYFTAKRALIQDLSVLPRPAYHKINMQYYLKPRLYLIRLIPISGIAIYTGRGCPFQCEFCCSSLIWKSHDKVKFVRTMPLDKVIEELDFLKKEYAIHGFYILDDTFAMDKERAYDFCRKLIKSDLDLIWAAETRVNLIDEEMVKLMKESGCIQLDFGVESGSQKLLDGIRKGITIAEIKRAFKICNRNGVRTFANMLLNLPGETEEDIKDDIRLIEEINPNVASFQITIPYPGTAIYEKHIWPKPAKEEYVLFSNRYVGVERFRMAFHNLNLQKILKDLATKYEKADPGYFLRCGRLRNKVFHSGKWLSYLKEGAQFFILQKLNRVIRGF